MKYKVLELFHDLEDYQETKAGRVCHVYRPGDPYPRRGKKATKARIAALSGTDNRRGIPLIAPAEDAPEQG